MSRLSLPPPPLLLRLVLPTARETPSFSSALSSFLSSSLYLLPGSPVTPNSYTPSSSYLRTLLPFSSSFGLFILIVVSMSSAVCLRYKLQVQTVVAFAKWTGLSSPPSRPFSNPVALGWRFSSRDRLVADDPRDSGRSPGDSSSPISPARTRLTGSPRSRVRKSLCNF